MCNYNDLAKFVSGYVKCALWSSDDDEGCPLDRGFWIKDFDADSLLDIVTDCIDFMKSNKEDLDAYMEQMNLCPFEMAGHDFWLTRNGHGAGFWDRGLGSLGTRLSEAAKIYGGSYVYVSGKNKVSIL